MSGEQDNQMHVDNMFEQQRQQVLNCKKMMVPLVTKSTFAFSGNNSWTFFEKF